MIDFHSDIRVCDSYRREVKPGLLQVALSWISRIDSHLPASKSSEIKSGIIDALGQRDAAVKMLPHSENVSAKGQSPALCFLGLMANEIQRQRMSLCV